MCLDAVCRERIRTTHYCAKGTREVIKVKLCIHGTCIVDSIRLVHSFRSIHKVLNKRFKALKALVPWVHLHGALFLQKMVLAQSEGVVESLEVTDSSHIANKK